jgi:hypothetical protein
MLTPSPHVVDHLRNDPVKHRELDKEYREKLTTLNQAEACIDRTRKLDELSYHRRRRAILAATQSANGHDQDE